jgi:hypothetical protein
LKALVQAYLSFNFATESEWTWCIKFYSPLFSGYFTNYLLDFSTVWDVRLEQPEHEEIDARAADFRVFLDATSSGPQLNIFLLECAATIHRGNEDHKDFCKLAVEMRYALETNIAFLFSCGREVLQKTLCVFGGLCGAQRIQFCQMTCCWDSEKSVWYYPFDVLDDWECKLDNFRDVFKVIKMLNSVRAQASEVKRLMTMRQNFLIDPNMFPSKGEKVLPKSRPEHNSKTPKKSQASKKRNLEE